MEIFLFFILACVLFIYWKKRKKMQDTSDSDKPVNYSDAQVVAYQMQFEERLVSDKNRPGSISYTSLYIYKNLMRKWYETLAGKYRYDPVKSQEIRNDWVEFMTLLKEFSWTAYRYMDSDEEDAEEYKLRMESTSQRLRIIQNAFATAVGAGAVRDLEKLLMLDDGKINREGEMAPEGKRYTLWGQLVDEEKDSD